MAGETVSKQRQKGTLFESQVVEYMRNRLQDERIERRACSGINDRGDISGVMLRGKRVVLECKNRREMKLAQWLDEAETERGNDDAEFGFVVHKRKGCGEKSMGETYVTCTLDTLCAIIAGNHSNLFYRPEERANAAFMLGERGIDHDG